MKRIDFSNCINRFSPFWSPELRDEHRDWLRGFSDRHLTKWNDLLENDRQSAMCECIYRAELVRRGVSVEPHDLGSGIAAPDFRCIHDGIEFYLEVVCLDVDRVTRETRLSSLTTSRTGSYSLLTSAYRSAIERKARQLGGLASPGVVAIGLFHGHASVYSTCPHEVEQLACGQSFIVVPVGRVSPDAQPFHQGTNLYKAAFHTPFLGDRPDDARRSVSAVLIGGFGHEQPFITGLLNPHAIRKLMPGFIPGVKFCECTLAPDHEAMIPIWHAAE